MKKKFFFLTAFFLLSLIIFTNCYASDERVVGGDKTTSSWPYIVALLYSDIESITDAQFCGGILINKDWILSAAHCVVNYESNEILLPNEVVVAIGQNQLVNDTERKKINRIIVHPNYIADGIEDDIALLGLKDSSEKEPAELYFLDDSTQHWDGV